MTELLPQIATIVVAVMSGGFATEYLRGRRDKEKSQLDLFYPTWKEEIARLNEEVQDLRLVVVALSAEVSRLGGNPHAVMTSIKKDPDDE